MTTSDDHTWAMDDIPTPNPWRVRPPQQKMIVHPLQWFYAERVTYAQVRAWAGRQGRLIPHLLQQVHADAYVGAYVPICGRGDREEVL